jgi:hypothetical protein
MLIHEGPMIETDMPASDADGPGQHHVTLTRWLPVSPQHDHGATTVWAGDEDSAMTVVSF